MDLTVFIQALTPVEKQAFRQLLEIDLSTPANETLRAFTYRMRRENKISERLFNIIIEEGHWVEEHFPNKKLLDMPVDDITYEKIHFLKGMGTKTWAEFVALRNANRQL